MNAVIVVINMAAAFWLAYQAGKFAVMLEYDRDVYDAKPDRMMQMFWAVDIILAVYFIMAIFGLGLQQGAAQ